MGLALRRHNEKKEDYHNHGVFWELIDFSSEFDRILEQHLSSATVLKGTSKTVENEILDCMIEVCRQVIKDQINKTCLLYTS